jgi:hypothetical protein
MKEPWEWVEDDILSLIRNKVREGTTLEYKACAALGDTEGIKKEISKDVSAFANSAGGTLIYGVTENKDHEPESIDGGYDPREISGEWLEQVINSNIQRRIDGIKINTVNLPATHPGKVLYVIYIPESNLAPHMAADDRFYKRFNFQRLSMKEHEVRNLMRQEHYPSREVVKAWRDTVINPLLQSLRWERDYLVTRLWEWDIYKGGLQGLGYISKVEYHTANQEDFVDLHPQVQALMQEHDKHVAAVYAHCEDMYKNIAESSFLRDIYGRVTSPESLHQLRVLYHSDLGHLPTDEAVMTKIFGSTPVEHHLRVLAQYVISGKGDLGSAFTTYAPLWNTYKDQFHALLKFPPLSEYKMRADEVREQLIDIIGILVTELKERRKELARQHGVPMDTPSSSGDL